MRAVTFLILSIIFYHTSFAQILQGQHEFMLSGGFISGRQIANDLSGENATVETLVTPSCFASYRYFILDRFAIGLTAGSQIIWGRSGDGYNNPYTYKLTNSTLAAELTYVIRDFGRFQMYTLLGAGVSNFVEHDIYSNVPVSSTYSGHNFNFQYTPYGMRFGGKFSGFFELGIGYKGIFNAGMSYKLNNRKLRRKQVELRKISSKEIIVLPYGYPVDSSLQDLGLVKADNPVSNWAGDFYKQMDNVSLKVKLLNGNVFRVSYIMDDRQNDVYSIWGKALDAANYTGFKTKVDSLKKLQFENNTCSHLVIYCPDYYHPVNSSTKINLTVNDSSRLQLKVNSKYIIRIAKEGRYNVASENGDYVVPLEIKFGNNYYIKATLDMPTGWRLCDECSAVEAPDDLKGEMESSVISDVHRLELPIR